MWVSVAVWQPCELVHTCYWLTYLLTATVDAGRSAVLHGLRAVGPARHGRRSRSPTLWWVANNCRSSTPGSFLLHAPDLEMILGKSSGNDRTYAALTAATYTVFQSLYISNFRINVQNFALKLAFVFHACLNPSRLLHRRDCGLCEHNPQSRLYNNLL